MNPPTEHIDAAKLRMGRRVFPPGPPMNASDTPDIVWKVKHVGEWVDVVFIDGGKARFGATDKVHVVILDLDTCKKTRHDWSDPVMGRTDEGTTRLAEVCLRCSTIRLQDVNHDGSYGKRRYYHQTDPRGRHEREG